MFTHFREGQPCRSSALALSKPKPNLDLSLHWQFSITFARIYHSWHVSQDTGEKIVKDRVFKSVVLGRQEILMSWLDPEPKL
jgi:hypothetical protein